MKKRPAAWGSRSLRVLLMWHLRSRTDESQPTVNIFDRQLNLIPGAAQDDVDDGVDVGNVDCAIAIHVGSSVVSISA